MSWCNLTLSSGGRAQAPSQSTQQTWTLTQLHGPNHLGVVGAQARSLRSSTGWWRRAAGCASRWRHVLIPFIHGPQPTTLPVFNCADDMY